MRLRTDEDVQQHDVWRDLGVSATATRGSTSDYRATNLAGYGELEWRIGTATVLVGRRARRTARRGLPRLRRRGLRARRNHVRRLAQPAAHLRRAAQRVRRRWRAATRPAGSTSATHVPDDRRSFDAEFLHSLELGLRAANATNARCRATSRSSICAARTSRCRPASSSIPGDPLTFVLYTDNAARGENYGVEGTLAVAAGLGIAC